MLFEIRDIDATALVVGHLQQKRAEGQTVGLTSGTFDLLHFQHFWYFIRCRRMCDILVVGVDSDEHVRERKGVGRPFITDFKRAIMVDALKPVSYAFIMCGLGDLARVAERIRPEFLFRNDEFAGREAEVVGKEHAGQVVIVRDIADYQCTSEIARAIATSLQL